MVSSAASTSSSAGSSISGADPRSVGSAPKPIPMAIMRNAHEVIRGAMIDIQSHLDQNDFEKARVLWRQFNRFSDLHMKMEEGRKNGAKGLFRLINDHSDGAAEAAGLMDCHRTLYELEEDVRDIFDRAPDVERAKHIYPVFMKENDKHLTEEENVLMPAIQKMIQQGVPVGKYLKTEVLPLVLKREGDMEFFIRFANETLERHDNQGPGQPRVRVFDHALWALATPEQWKEWTVWIEESLSPEKYLEITTAIKSFEEEQEAKNLGKKVKQAAEQSFPKEAPPVANVTTVKPQGLFGRFFPKKAAA
jgi:hypothetical protein